MATNFVAAYGNVVAAVSGVVSAILAGKFAGDAAAIPAILMTLLPLITSVGSIETLVSNAADFLDPANAAALDAAFTANWLAGGDAVVDEVESILMAVLRLLIKSKVAPAPAAV